MKPEGESSPVLYRPAEMRWIETDDALHARTVVFRRRRGQALFTIPFLLFWFGFLAVWYTLAIRSGNVIMLVFPLLHVGVGLMLAWNTARLFNTVTITAGPGGVSFDEGPVPTRMAVREFVLDRIRGFQTTAVRVRRGGVSHRVAILTAEGVSFTLPMMFDDPAEALYASKRLDEIVEEARVRRTETSSAAYRD